MRFSERPASAGLFCFPRQVGQEQGKVLMGDVSYRCRCGLARPVGVGMCHVWTVVPQHCRPTPVPQIAVAAIAGCFDTKNVLQEIPKLPEVFRGLQNIEFGSVRADGPDQGTALANLTGFYDFLNSKVAVGQRRVWQRPGHECGAQSDRVSSAPETGRSVAPQRTHPSCQLQTSRTAQTCRGSLLVDRVPSYRAREQRSRENALSCAIKVTFHHLGAG